MQATQPRFGVSLFASSPVEVARQGLGSPIAALEASHRNVSQYSVIEVNRYPSMPFAQPQVEQPQIEQPPRPLAVRPPVERLQVEQLRVEQLRVEQPQAEQPRAHVPVPIVIVSPTPINPARSSLLPSPAPGLLSPKSAVHIVPPPPRPRGQIQVPFKKRSHFGRIVARESSTDTVFKIIALSNAADSVVGRHPDAVPLKQRPPPPQDDYVEFPWVPQGMNVGLAHALDTLPPPPPELAPLKEISNRRKRELTHWGTVSYTLGKEIKGVVGEHPGGKENAAIPSALLHTPPKKQRPPPEIECSRWSP